MADERPNRAIPVERPGQVDSAQFVAQHVRVERTLRGPRRTIKGYVKGLVGGDDRRIWSATFVRGIPDLGSADDVMEGAVLGRIAANQRTNSPSQAEVELEWGYFAEDDFINPPGTDPEMAQIEVISTVIPVVTHLDVFGNPMILEHEFRPPGGGPGVLGPPQVAELELQLPTHTVIFRRRENASPGAVGTDGNPGNKSKQYTGAINADGNIFGDNKHFWMCTHLGGISDDGGVTYNVSYHFLRHPDTWNPTGVYRDPKTGAPVVDPAVGPLKGPTPDPGSPPPIYGQRPFQVTGEEIFEALSLPF